MVLCIPVPPKGQQLVAKQQPSAEDGAGTAESEGKVNGKTHDGLLARYRRYSGAGRSDMEA